MTVLLLFRCVGKCLSLAAQNYGVAGSNPAAATNPGAFLAERARETGRKRLCMPADPSVRIAFPVAREFFLSSPRTRRDAFPPSSGGPFPSLSSSLSLLLAPSLMWRGCG
jgi:hypothetical protein